MSAQVSWIIGCLESSGTYVHFIGDECRIVRLGSRRHAAEGPRIGTVRRPPRGVRKSEFARENWYDVWYPLLSPSPGTLKLGLQRRHRREMGGVRAQVPRGR
jgi:hypothetical protein